MISSWFTLAPFRIEWCRVASRGTADEFSFTNKMKIPLARNEVQIALEPRDQENLIRIWSGNYFHVYNTWLVCFVGLESGFEIIA